MQRRHLHLALLATVAVLVVVVLVPTLVVVSRQRRSNLKEQQSSPTALAPAVKPTTLPEVAPTTPVTTSSTDAPVSSPVQAPEVVIPPGTTSPVILMLIDASTNTEVVQVEDGNTIDVATLPGTDSIDFNIRAIKADPQVQSVLFVETDRTESNEPFAFCGDNGGDYNSCSELKFGQNTVTVVPFAAGDVKLPTVQVTFEILDSRIPPGRWIEIQDNAPIDARHEACFVMVDNPTVGRRGYLVGGRGTKATNVFDPVTRSWSVGATPPIQLHHMQCVQARGKLWIVAAWTGWYPTETNPDFIYIYDPAADTWTTGTALPENRRRGSSAVVVSPDEGTIYVSHGNNGGHETGNHAESLAYLDSYDIDTDTWTALSSSAPHPRDHTGGAWINGKICVAGGRNGGELGWPAVAPTDCYDVAKGEWSVEAPLPSPRGGSSYGSTCDGHYLIVAGGEGGGKAWKATHVFDGITWGVWDHLNIGRHGSGLAVDCVCNSIVIASGSAGQGGGPETLSVEMYFPNGSETSCTL